MLRGFRFLNDCLLESDTEVVWSGVFGRRISMTSIAGNGVWDFRLYALACCFGGVSITSGKHMYVVFILDRDVEASWVLFR